MMSLIDKYLKEGYKVSVNKEYQMIIVDPDTNYFFTLGTLSIQEIQYLTFRKQKGYGPPIRTRFIHR
jgi:hypothetical protein